MFLGEIMNQEYEIRKQKILELMSDSFYVPMKEKELAMFMQVDKGERELFHNMLEELLKQGEIKRSIKGKFVKAESRLLVGTFISNIRGFGFVEIEGMEEDIFIPEEFVGKAFHQDQVRVEITKEGKDGKRREGRILEILSHGITTLVGTYEPSKNFGFVIPDNMKIPVDIFVPKERSKGAVYGHKVVCEITSYGDTRHKPEGKIIEILGHINDPGVDILSIAKGYDLPFAFPEKVMNQTERIPEEVSEADRAMRMDLRHMQMVTIDGEDAKDLDDAVSLSKEGDLYFLGVHIADVSNYVQENSALDWEAIARGTSVYLVDRVIPMLPHKLSNGICSLNQGVDRLALSCLMTIDKKGEVIDYQIVESVICVDRRMTYTNVAKILENSDPAITMEYEAFVPMFELMAELSGLLRQKRQKRGSIDFDFPEAKIRLDENGRPVEIKPYDRNVATKIIEDFMLIANETVAQHYYWMEIPFVYRTHENPDNEKMMKLATLIRNFGYHFKVGKEEVHPKEVQKLLGKIQDTPEEAFISRLALRSMKQAKYSVECTGHFGLACPYYCHFTSPIRRYPDLQIHRIIKEQLRGKMTDERIQHYKEKLPTIAKKSSEMERRADEAERETNKLKKAQYMEKHIGEIYEGIISGITSWGIYVELSNTVEGLLRVADLPGDYYYYDETSYEMIGRDTGKKYRLGESIRIQVADVDLFSRTVDFIIPDDEEEEFW